MVEYRAPGCSRKSRRHRSKALDAPDSIFVPRSNYEFLNSLFFYIFRTPLTPIRICGVYWYALKWRPLMFPCPWAVFVPSVLSRASQGAWAPKMCSLVTPRWLLGGSFVYRPGPFRAGPCHHVMPCHAMSCHVKTCHIMS